MNNLPDLSDYNSDQTQIGRITLNSYGGIQNLSGEIYTVSCSDDNSIVKRFLHLRERTKFW